MTRARIVAFVAIGMLASCASKPPISADPNKPTSSAWFDEVAEPKHNALLRVNTAVLLKDKVYAPLVRQLFGAMTEKALHSGTEMTAALEGAEEIDIVLQDDQDPVLLLRKVPASLDPASMAGLDGSTQWKVSKTHVPDVQTFDFVPESGALYLLIDRTWIVTAGLGQQRVQTALIHAQGRPVSPDAPLDVPVSLRVPGATMERVAVARGVRVLRPIFEELEEAKVELHVDKHDKSRDDEIVAELRYAGVSQATHAEEMVNDVLGAFGRRGGKRWEWLNDAKVERKEQHVTARAKLPAWVLVALADVDSSIF
jgi:hypothetical protein